MRVNTTHGKKIARHTFKSFYAVTKSLFWFSMGGLLGLFLFVSFIFIYFQKKYNTVVYPGVMVNGVSFDGKTKDDVHKFFENKNNNIANTKFVFTIGNRSKTITAQELELGYNSQLLADQAYIIGRSNDLFSNVTLVLQAYVKGVNLPASYHYSEENLKTYLYSLTKDLKLDPIDALFTFQNGKVSAFRLSKEGQEPDFEGLNANIAVQIIPIISGEKAQTITIPIPIKKIKPEVTTEDVNQFGIKELIGIGTSFFQGSIPNRIYNVNLAASRLNGILVKPDEVFSFDKALGDVSAFTGYKQAYVIENGHTILGDGGGVCQVSTTFFRALLNSGLPIVERTAHAYRVGYYEQGFPPGIDATIYVPSVDLKFKNDTGNYILVQTEVDENQDKLTFFLYGTKDGRQTTLTQPVITDQTPPPDTLYQDDPTLPKGTLKQVDYAASGAHVSFTRNVVKDGKIIITDKFISNYRPWQAIFLRGTSG